MSIVISIGLVPNRRDLATCQTIRLGPSVRFVVLEDLSCRWAVELTGACRRAEASARWFVAVDTAGDPELDLVYTLATLMANDLGAEIDRIAESTSQLLILLHDLGTNDWCEDSHPVASLRSFIAEEYRAGGPIGSKVHRFVNDPSPTG